MRPGNGVTRAGSAVPVTVPVQLVVADAGTHLLFVDNPWDGTLTLREGVEGAGSGHDRVGTGELRMEGGPVRGWVMAGTAGAGAADVGVTDRGACAAARVGVRPSPRAGGRRR